MANEIITLETPAQRLQLVPRLGGGVAAWDWKSEAGWTPLFRPWDRASEDRYTLACFPLVPWSNRITAGGFDFDGVHYPVRPNRAGEPYPIHGDGWLQPWRVTRHEADSVTLELESQGYDGNPYHYRSRQRYTLLPDGLAIELAVTHLGDRPLPYGLGLHPYFMRNEATRLRARSDGVWLSGADPIPVAHSSVLPPGWDYNRPAPLDGPMIDNCFSGWDGVARIDYPDRGLSIIMRMQDSPGYTLMYRPPGLNFFCLEPITHPIDAFHMPGQPGLVPLITGQDMALHTRFAIGASENVSVVSR
jgi:aldose 1-epimerase